MDKITFKQFFLEAAVGREPEYLPLEEEKILEIIDKHCHNAKWMLENDRPIWRGDVSRNFHKSINSTGYVTVDSMLTTRESQNTVNYYTVLLDNLPAYKDFPKRSKSFVASTNKFKANFYGDACAIIPYDDAKIGIVGENDMWDIRIPLFGKPMFLENISRKFAQVRSRMETIPGMIDQKSSIWEFFQTLEKLINEQDAYALEFMADVFKHGTNSYSFYKKFLSKKPLMELLNEALGPQNTGMKSVTSKDQDALFDSSEVWVSGKMLFIRDSEWSKLVEKVKNDNI